MTQLPAPTMPGLYTAAELARALNLPETTVRHHCRAGWLQGVAYGDPGGRWVIPEDEGRIFAARMVARRAEISRRSK